MKCVKCNNEVKLDIAKALDEEGEVFKDLFKKAMGGE